MFEAGAAKEGQGDAGVQDSQAFGRGVAGVCEGLIHEGEEAIRLGREVGSLRQRLPRSREGPVRSAEDLINEEDKRRRLAAGEAGLDIYDMRAKLASLGLKYV